MNASSSNSTQKPTEKIEIVVENQSSSSNNNNDDNNNTNNPETPSENYRKMKLELEQFVSEVDTFAWDFQTQVDKKARIHVVNMIYDHYLSHQLKKGEKKKMQTKEDAIRSFHDAMHYAYKRWCSVSGQSESKLSPDKVFPALEGDKRLVADMLLLVMLWGEVDIVRSQNNICALIYHAAKDFLKNKQLLDSQAAGTGQQQQKKISEHNENIIRQHISVGKFIRHESLFLYQLVRQVGFNRLLRNEFFVAWDDFNCTCWTPGFVTDYMKHKSFAKAFRFSEKSLILEAIYKEMKKLDYNINEVAVENLQHIFRFLPKDEKQVANTVCKKWNTALEAFKVKPPQTGIVQLASSSSEQSLSALQAPPQEDPKSKSKEAKPKLTAKEKEQKLTKEKAKFVETWKTYHDRAGGFQGWRGYLTMLTNYSLVVYIQLIFLSLMLYIFIEFPAFNSNLMVIIPACGVPLVLCAIIFILNTFFLQFRTKPFKHPYALQLPRRDAGIQRSTFKLNYLLWILIMLSQIIVVRFLVFQNLHEATKTVINQVARNQLSWLSISALILIWIPVFLVYWTVTPVIFTLWKGLFGFFHGLKIRVNGCITYGDFKNKLRSTTTLKHFQKKLLGPENKDLHLDEVRYRFAIFFNEMIDDFYHEHMISLSEKKRLSFFIEPSFDETQKISAERFVEQIRRITTVQPLSQDFTFHLIKWMNNLYMNMPTDVSVETMKRLVIMTPVYKESVIYSWKELTAVTNTNSSFLLHAIKKYPHDWRNFIKMEAKDKHRLLNIEEKLRAGLDISKHFTPPELVEKIRFWASNRFQPVSRTVQGMTKIAKALKTLLKLQTMGKKPYTEEEINAIVKDKFIMICGAQVLDKSTWREGEDNTAYVEDFLLLARKFGDFMKLAFQKKVGKKFVGVLMRKNEKGELEQEYQIELFGKFDSMGQGKPSHQAFMLQFYDGSIIQAIDCNQAAVYPQVAFVPNVLREFHHNKKLKILGFPEYIFTESWSPAGYGAAFTEKVFGTMIQRAWTLLSMRMHYGHPDFIDGLWVMFTTGMSQLSYVSEDIFSGFDTLLNGGQIGFVEYMICGKARDVCLFTTSKFNRKIAGGAAQVACCRQIREIMTSWHFNIAEKLTLSYSTLAHYLSTVVIMVSTFLLFFVRVIILTMRVFEKESLDDATGSVWKSVDYLFIVQLGAALSLPGFLQMILDFGFLKAFYEFFIKLKVLLISVYSVFHLLNTAIYFHYGFIDAAQYLASGRGAGLDHESIGKIVATFDATHFVPSIVLFLYSVIGLALGGSFSFFLYNLILGAIWLWSPFMFNRGSFPIGVDYQTWVYLYNKDLDYVFKWKVRQVISELSIRTKNIKKVERNGKEEVNEFEDLSWLPDIENMDAKTYEETLKKHEARLAREEEEEEKYFKHEQEKKFKYANRFIYKLNRLRQNIRALTWNFFLMVTLSGIKYLTLIYALWKIMNPMTGLPSNASSLVESKANDKRFIQMQRHIQDLSAENKKLISENIEIMKSFMTRMESNAQAEERVPLVLIPKNKNKLKEKELDEKELAKSKIGDAAADIAMRTEKFEEMVEKLQNKLSEGAPHDELVTLKRKSVSFNPTPTVHKLGDNTK